MVDPIEAADGGAMESGIPGYWMNETSGVLRPAIEAYLNDEPLSSEQIVAIRAYLRQWMAAPGWTGSNIEALRAGIAEIYTKESLRYWLHDAEEEGIDPL